MEPPVSETVAARVQAVLTRIHHAAGKVGRNPQAIRLVAATKTVSAERIREGIAAGLTNVGENRLQEALSKVEALRDTGVCWHFIGQLQRRKVKSVVGVFDLLHSVDSLDLVKEIDRRACDARLCQEVLLEVNIGHEPTKAGFLIDDLFAVAPDLAKWPHLRVKGLMAIPPRTAEAEQARPYFQQLRVTAERLAREVPSLAMDELSMGMSDDYEIAIEEGATLVRIGTAIFGERDE